MKPKKCYRVDYIHCCWHENRFTCTNIDWCRVQHWKIMPRSFAMLPDGQRPDGNISPLRGIIFQCWSGLTVNICFVISRNSKTKWVFTFVIIKPHIEYALILLILWSNEKNRRKCTVRRSLHHVPREQGLRDAMFSGNMSLHWRNRQHCLFLHITWRASNQSRSRNLDRYITMNMYTVQNVNPLLEFDKYSLVL